MSGLKRLIFEVHRRSLWQVLGIYLAGSWIAYQVTLSIADGIGLPDWVPRLAIVIFILGLPIVLATAFVQEGLPLSTRDARDSTESAVDRRGPQPSTQPRNTLDGLLTWNRAISLGVLAFAVLGVAASGFMGMRAAGIAPFGSLAARGELPNRTIILADVEPITGDSLIAKVVAEALRVDISQSSLLHAADPSQIRFALERMGRTGPTPLTGDVAREVAIRLGAGALIEGEVGHAAGGYLLTARLVTADSGTVLLSARETAKDSTELLPAVGRLSRHLRERAGESLKTIRATPPLAQVTTSSLPALRLYVAGRAATMAGNPERAYEMWGQALTFDSQFANAHRAMGVYLLNGARKGDSMLYHFRKALEQSNRLTAAELHHLRGIYALSTGQFARARSEFETLLAMDSTDATALINLGEVHYLTRDYAGAEELSHRAELLGFRALTTTYWNQVMAELTQRKFDAAKQTVARAAALYPDADILRGLSSLVPLAENNWPVAERALWNYTKGGVKHRIALATYRLTRGQYASAVALSEPATEANDRAIGAILISYANTWVRQQPQVAARDLARVMMDPALIAVGGGDRPDPWAALALAAAGDVRTARQLIARCERECVPELRWWYGPVLLAAQAFVDRAEGQRDSAINHLREAQRQAHCVACLEALRGQVFEAFQQRDSAAAAYDRYINTGWDDRFQIGRNLLPNDPFLLAFAHEHAGILYEQLGKYEQARSHYASFVNMWANADAELQPRVAAARARLARLAAEPD